ncbi:MAG: hypothetical protein JXA94_06690 [Parachlamydiales bacterium]|nr:hypothetical protein [Parachlamydiales bacterium]
MSIIHNGVVRTHQNPEDVDNHNIDEVVAFDGKRTRVLLFDGERYQDEIITKILPTAEKAQALYAGDDQVKYRTDLAAWKDLPSDCPRVSATAKADWILKNVKPVQTKIEVLQEKATNAAKKLHTEMQKHPQLSKFLISLGLATLLFRSNMFKSAPICKETGRPTGIFDKNGEGVFVQYDNGRCRVIYCS